MESVKGTRVISVRTATDLVVLDEAGELTPPRRAGCVSTETVYGLGGNALDPEAAAKIYAAKGAFR